MKTAFSHVYSSGLRFGWSLRDGTAELKVVKITPTFPLDPNNPSFDRQKLGELARAASAYFGARCLVEFEDMHSL